jgi:histidinol-phosphatase
VSTIDSIGEAHLAYASVASWRQHADIDGFLDLEAKVWRSRGVGDFWQHMLVAEGAMDIAAECIVSLWDLAAVQIVVEEAGGRFTDLAGKAHPDGGSALSTNGLLHDEALRLLHRRA